MEIIKIYNSKFGTYRVVKVRMKSGVDMLKTQRKIKFLFITYWVDQTVIDNSLFDKLSRTFYFPPTYINEVEKMIKERIDDKAFWQEYKLDYIEDKPIIFKRLCKKQKQTKKKNN